MERMATGPRMLRVQHRGGTEGWALQGAGGIGALHSATASRMLKCEPAHGRVHGLWMITR